jgi:hypothetical protein
MRSAIVKEYWEIINVAFDKRSSEDEQQIRFKRNLFENKLYLSVRNCVMYELYILNVIARKA